MSDPLNKIKIHIVFEFSDEPTGGGNQFLKSLKNLFKSRGVYEENPVNSDVILFNSHQQAHKVGKLKLKYPNKFFVHRIDGPMRLYNNATDKRDDIVYLADKHLAEATIFQSEWSQQQNHRTGLPQNLFETVIPNAPDPSIFNRIDKKKFSTKRKIRLIATSWSKNWKKGFKIYQWLDENLDLEKYEMLFVGNSPVEFKNIKKIPPVDSKGVAEKLKENDIFIFASPIEACSNSLLEALHCGLPVIGVNNSSNPGLIGKGGEVFDRPGDILVLLEKIVNNYESYQTNINNPKIEEIGRRYYDFITNSCSRFINSGQKHVTFGWLDYAKFIAMIAYYRFAG